MPRFVRFVILSSLVLLCIWLFYSPADVPIASTAKKDHAQSAKGPPVQMPQSTKNQDKRRKPVVPQDSGDSQVIFQQGTLRAKLAAQFPYDVMSVFPSFIWQTWRTTPSDGNFQFRAPEATWTAKHPGYIHEVITDEVAAKLVHHLYAQVPEVLEAYDSLPQPILKADFFRYLILLARGGVYSDIDTEALRPAWEWVPDELFRERYGLVVGIEADPNRADWAKWYSRRVQLCQWTMRAKPGHPALVEAVSRLTESTLAMKSNGTMDSHGRHHIIEWTGPGMWTDAVFAYFNSGPTSSADAQRPAQVSRVEEPLLYSWRNLTGITEAKKILDVIVLPITGFSPGQGHMGSEDFTDSHAMVKHNFEGSWKPEEERMKEESA